MSIEDTLFSNKLIRGFCEQIREKDLSYVIRELCLLGIQVFADRNPTLTHYSVNDIKKCLQNFVEESNTRDYYRKKGFETLDPNAQDHYHSEDEGFKKRRHRHKRRQKSKHLKSQAILNQKIAQDVQRNKLYHSRSQSRKSRGLDKHKTVYSTQSESPQNSGKKENLDQSYQNSHKNYYRAMSPSHSKPQARITESYGPPQVLEEVEIVSHDPGMGPHPIGAPPPEVVHHEVIHEAGPPLPPPPPEEYSSQERTQKQVVTTLDRSMNYSPGKPYKARATSPLKSCIQNAEVKVARGGVAISFDPWKPSKKSTLKRKEKIPRTEEEYEYDHICDDEEIRIADGHYFNNQVKNNGIKPKIDPKVKNLARRDMQIALKQRQKLAHQRKTEKEWVTDKNEKMYTKKKRRNKSPYKNIKSKIKYSVLKDRSKARNRTMGRNVRKICRSVDKSFTQREVCHSRSGERVGPPIHPEPGHRSYYDIAAHHMENRPEAGPTSNHIHFGEYGRHPSFGNEAAAFAQPREETKISTGHDESRIQAYQGKDLNEDIEPQQEKAQEIAPEFNKYRSLRCPYEGVQDSPDRYHMEHNLHSTADMTRPGWMSGPINPYQRK